MKILIVEDEVKVCSFLKQGFEEELFTVDTAHDGEQGLFLALTEDYDAMVLDLMLPKKGGMQVLEELRREKSTPVLILTAKGQLENKIEGLNAGADDYLTKPFALAECIARVRSLVRRAQVERPSSVLSAGDLTLDQMQHAVRRGSTMLELTAKEFKLLEYLLRNKNAVLTRSAIIEHIWDITFDSETNVLDVYMTRLRKKVDEGFEPKLIHTVRGVGYVLKDPDA
ncbi:MAG: response regulator transcription factor [Ignavibacteriae bacterium]|nr:response regulator transcription factor [Ignavibacteriota bacterium]